MVFLPPMASCSREPDPRRDLGPRKIARGVARIQVTLEETLYLGNLVAKRDWGHAKDCVEGMHMLLEANKADDFVLATGEMHSVREMVELSFAQGRLARRADVPRLLLHLS